MRDIACKLSVALIILGPCCAQSLADGGQIRLIEDRGDYRFCVFTSPNPLRAGPIDISILLQDAATHKPVANANIVVELTEVARPDFSIRAHATTVAATNKLMQAALVELPRSGAWNVMIVCDTERGYEEVEFTMEAGTPLPRWLSVWPLYTWPIGVVLLFATHRFLVARRRHSATHTAPRQLSAMEEIASDNCNACGSESLG